MCYAGSGYYINMGAKMAYPRLSLFALKKFKRGAIVYVWGYELDDEQMQGAGLKSAELAIEFFDAVVQSRMSLVPLLDDPDLSIRVFAAGFLVKVMPERALPVLEELAERGPAFIDMTAHYLLERHKYGTDL